MNQDAGECPPAPAALLGVVTPFCSWSAAPLFIGFIIAAIAVGAGIHGCVPDGALAGIMGQQAWWSAPLGVLGGRPSTPTPRASSWWAFCSSWCCKAMIFPVKGLTASAKSGGRRSRWKI